MDLITNATHEHRQKQIIYVLRTNNTQNNINGLLNDYVFEFKKFRKDKCFVIRKRKLILISCFFVNVFKGNIQWDHSYNDRCA